jgi:hypothetical protein
MTDEIICHKKEAVFPIPVLTLYEDIHKKIILTALLWRTPP